MTILVVGGSGFFGRLLVEELLRCTDAHITLGGRRRKRLDEVRRHLGAAAEDRVGTRVMDLNIPGSIELQDIQLAICAAGPFQQLPTTLALRCLDQGVHYIDLSDSRDFVGRVHHLVQERQPSAHRSAICTGWSSMPALTALMTRMAADGMDPVNSIDLHLAPGNRAPRSVGTVASLLASVGQPFNIWRQGAWQSVTGWSEPQAFDFPAPVGRRVGYLVDVPDHEIFPRLFDAGSVAFRVSAELSFLNHGVSFLAWAVRKRLLRSWMSWASALRWGMACWGFLGHAWGSVGVNVSGTNKDGQSVSRKICLPGPKWAIKT